MSVKIALAGNPNSGKTTLFNALTGSNQFVGNWPGVTVEKKEGKLKKTYQISDEEVVIMDLPGIYSLSPYTLEEVVARNYLVGEKPDVILNIVDGTNLERNLYLSTQLLELGIPVVMAVNMMDAVKKNGDELNVKNLSKKLGCKVTLISALKNEGIDQAVKLSIEAAKEGAKEVTHHFDEKVEDAIASVMDQIEDINEMQRRFVAIKLLERDDKIDTILKNKPDVNKKIEILEKEFDDDTESIITNERYTYISSIIQDCYKKKNKKKETTSDKIDKIVTNRWLALPIFAVVMFIVYYVSVTTIGTYATDWVNDAVFGDGWYLFGIGRDDYDDAVNQYAEEHIWTDEVVATVKAADEAGEEGASDLLSAIEDGDYGAFDEAYQSYADVLAEAGFDITEDIDEAVEDDAFPANEDYGVWVTGVPVIVEKGLDAIKCADWLKGLIIDGIVAGVGAVLGFVPQMLVLFIFLAFLESCGYMARVAFIMDRIFRRFGLSGKSFIPMLIGSGCGIPGIMASRTIENERDRRMTVMTTTFVPCGAKLPIIGLIAGAFFGESGWVSTSAYFIGIAAIIVSGIILKKTKIFAGDPAPFVMELPAYHLPTVGNVLRSMWERGWLFIKKAGTIILLSTIVIWFLSFFGWADGSFGMLEEDQMNLSILAKMGKAVAWIFKPLGWGNWKMAVAAITGLVAKENVVGTFGILFGAASDAENGSIGLWNALGASLVPLAAYSFMVFNLLCAPCFAAMGAIKREMNNTKWFWFAIGYQCILAYLVSLCIYQIGALFTNTVSVNIVGLIVAILIVVFMLYLLFRPYKESKTLNVHVKTANG
ncbi:MAG: ferrous iron transport protein B [Lachnospiraceae bacterium]|nr:ferrous iron transport protein B [Lachnospiraceae bacterium]